MSSVLSSQSLVIAAAMVVSSTALFLVFSWQKQESQNPPPQPKLRSCLYSGEKKRERKKNKKVKFAANVKEPSGNGEDFRRQFEMPRKVETSCRNEITGIQGMHLNRIALYNGILKNRG